MPRDISLIFKLESSLAKIFKKEIEDLGFDTSKLVTDEDIFDTYCSYLSRLVETRSRKIHKADGFICPKDVEEGLAWLEDKIENGKSVNAHLNKATKTNKLDGLLYDWGIQHLHLGKKLDASGFVERTGFVLFAIFKADDVYFIDIRNHNGWSDTDLLEIVNKNWPNLISNYRITGRSEINPSSSTITKFRKKGINHIIKLSDGNSFIPIGGGITAAATSIHSRRILIELIHKLGVAKSQIEKESRFFAKNLKPKGRAFRDRYKYVFVCKRKGDKICFYDIINNNYWEPYLTIPTLKEKYGV